MEMTRTEALTLALKLAVQAPSQAQSDEALAHARDIAVGMHDRDVLLLRKQQRWLSTTSVSTEKWHEAARHHRRSNWRYRCVCGPIWAAINRPRCWPVIVKGCQLHEVTPPIKQRKEDANERANGRGAGKALARNGSV